MMHNNEREKSKRTSFFLSWDFLLILLLAVLLAERNADKEACTKEMEENVAEKLR